MDSLDIKIKAVQVLGSELDAKLWLQSDQGHFNGLTASEMMSNGDLEEVMAALENMEEM